MNMFKQNKFILDLCKQTALILCWLFLGLLTHGLADTIVDNRGRQIDVTRPFKRIISLYSAHTENLFYLGLDPQIIGVSINDDFPAEVRNKQRFSYHEDPEKFLGARPDLVLIRPMIDNGYPGFVQQLERYHIQVVSLQPATVEEMYAYWLILGKLTGKTLEAKKMVHDFQEKTAGIRNLAQTIPQKKQVYFQAIHTRMKTFTPGAMPIFALETAGGVNVAKDASASRNTNIAVYGKEQILAKASEIDVFLAQKGIMNPVSKEMILNEPGFHIIKAVKNKQIFLIDENIVSRPVPRLYQGMVAIGQILYPDIFGHFPAEKDEP